MTPIKSDTCEGICFATAYGIFRLRSAPSVDERGRRKNRSSRPADFRRAETLAALQPLRCAPVLPIRDIAPGRSEASGNPTNYDRPADRRESVAPRRVSRTMEATPPTAAQMSDSPSARVPVGTATTGRGPDALVDRGWALTASRPRGSVCPPAPHRIEERSRRAE